MLLGQEMHLIKSFEDSWKNPHGWETIQLLEVWQEIHTLKNHTEEKPFGCSKCDKKFARAATLKIHERIHIYKKPFSCSMCDKTFRESATLKVHERNHTGEKPFSCSKCNKTFRKSELLKRHERVLTGDKPVELLTVWQEVRSSIYFEDS